MNKKVLSLVLAGVITASSVLPTAAFATNVKEDVKVDSAVTTETPKETEAVSESLNVTRIQGKDRYLTAVEASKKTFPNGAKYAAIATGENFVDGLVGGALTSQEGFPLLLTRKNSISKEVIDEIKRLKPEEIFIFGGDAAVSSDVEKEIKKTGIKVERLAGKNRKETAQEIGVKRWNFRNQENKVGTDADAVVDGFKFADALSAGPFLGQMTRNGKGYYNFAPWIKGTPVSGIDMVFGGTAAIPKGPIEQYRFAGSTRYETAVEVAKAYKDVLKMDIDTVVLVSGEDFPDGLTAAEIAGEEKAAVLLTNAKTLNASTKKFIEENKNIKNIIILGGNAAVSEEVEKALKEIKFEVPKVDEEKEEIKTDAAVETPKEETKGEVKADSAIQE